MFGARSGADRVITHLLTGKAFTVVPQMHAFTELNSSITPGEMGGGITGYRETL